MMTFKEINKRYAQVLHDAHIALIAEKKACLQRYGLDRKVIRLADGKIGWLDIDSYNQVSFYPMKKDGTRSINSRGWFKEDDVRLYFEPYKEADE